MKGAHIAAITSWFREAYGEAAYAAALGTLAAEARHYFEETMLRGGWVPVAVWDQLLAELRRQAATLKGESEHVFDTRLVREGGSVALRKFYGFMIAILPATAFFRTAPKLISRAYDKGLLSVTRNEKGLAVMNFSGPGQLRDRIKRYHPIIVQFALEQSGVKTPISQEFTRDVLDANGNVVIEHTIRY